MDWLKDFTQRFELYPELTELKMSKFHGKLEINFSDGIPQNINLNRHRRAKNIECDSSNYLT